MGTRENAIARVQRFEGTITHMYQDTNANVTIGIGHMIPNEGASTGLSMVVRGSTTAATDEQKKADYTSVQAAPGGMVAGKYKPYTKLDLSSGEAANLLGTDVDRAISDCGTRFSGFSSFPGLAQEALIDMMFNIGLTNFTRAKWPKLFTAIDGKKWADAANESNRPEVPADRNAEIKKLFNDAAAKTPMVAVSGGVRGKPKKKAMAKKKGMPKKKAKAKSKSRAARKPPTKPRRKPKSAKRPPARKK